MDRLNGDVTDQYAEYVGRSVMVINQESEYADVVSRIYEIYDRGELGILFKLTNGLIFKQSELAFIEV